MSQNHDLFERTQELKKQGLSVPRIRQKLLQDGWDIGAVDTALWRTGYRGWRSVFAMQRIRRLVMVLGVVAFGAAVFGLSLFLQQEGVRSTIRGVVSGAQTEQNDPTKPKPAEQLTAEGMVSSEAGISFDFPEGWTLSNLTDPEDVDGFLWQVEPERNSVVRAELEKRYGIVDDERSAQDASQSILSDPLTSQLATVTITVAKEPSYEVEADIDEWRDSVENIQGDLGFTLSDFEQLAIGGVEAYSYITTLQTGPIKVSTRDYVLIKGDTRIEATTFPVESQNSETFRSIISSIRFL